MIYDAEAHADLIARRVADQLARSLADEVLTTEQAAELLQIHPNTLAALVAKGEVPGRRVGREWRFRRSSLLDHISASNAHQRGPEPVANAAD